jgi:hypothetical protein
MKKHIKSVSTLILSFVAAAVCGVLIGSIGGIQSAQANSSSYFSHTWTSYKVVQIGIGGNMSTIDSNASLLSNADSASQAWDNVSSAPRWGYFSNGNYSNVYVGYSSNPCHSDYSTNSIEVWMHAYPLSSQAANQTECETGSYITRSNVRFDTSNRTWHVGSSSAPSGTSDFRGIAAHEFGHSTGFDGHFPNGGGTCASSPTTSDNTMCSTFSGTGYHWRTLGSSDIAEFQAAYEN